MIRIIRRIFFLLASVYLIIGIYYAVASYFDKGNLGYSAFVIFAWFFILLAKGEI